MKMLRGVTVFSPALKLGLVRLLPGLLVPFALAAQVATFHTNLGDINVNLLPGSAPITVANFLSYVNSGAYSNSIFHRSVPYTSSSGIGIIQGGGFQVAIPPSPIAQNAPIVLEYVLPNTRGTIAMARTGNTTTTTTATNEWFFNTVDNSSTLGSGNNGGYAVFGNVADQASLAVMDKIAAVPVPNPSPFGANSTFNQIPLMNYTQGSGVQTSNYVIVSSITMQAAGPVPAIASNGVISASGFGAYTAAAPGSFIEIYGSNLAGTTRSWGTSDFVRGVGAPTVLDGVSVTVNGIAAYVFYVSPTQVDVQVPAPSGFPISGTVPVVLTYFGQASNSVSLTMQATAPGLLAPAIAKLNGAQFVIATHADGTDIAPSGIAGIAASPAKPGETIVFYGLGFGAVSPTSDPIAGFVAQGSSYLSTSVQFSFDGIVANTPPSQAYNGLAPGYVGLYQFNVTVPSNTPTGNAQVQVTEGGTAIGQTLYIPIGN